jgi:Peptidase A4 family
MPGRPHSCRSRALLACVPVLGVAMLANAGPASASRAPASTRAEVRAVLEHLLAGWHPTNRAIGGHEVGGTGLKRVGSLNWSGYADTDPKGGTYSSVAGKWAEPRITGCKASVQSWSIFWVGIDGFSTTDRTVEQDGSYAVCPGGGSKTPAYGTWWERYPKRLTVVGASAKPGDEISASVIRKGTSYTFKVTDSTTKGNSFSTARTCAACKDQSAEWIAERPWLGSPTEGHFSSLPDFGTWRLTSATAKAGSKSGRITTFPDNEVTMFNKGKNGRVMALPGALTRSGDSFKDVWKASS